MGLAFSNYLNFERGKSLPQPWRFKRLLAALGLGDGTEGARRLAEAYLVTLLGSDELLKLSRTSPGESAGGAESWKLAELAARQALAQRTVRMSLEQFSVLAKDASADACHTALVNTPGWVERAELAAMTGLKPPEVARALPSLREARLLETDGTRVRSLLAGKYVAKPPLSPASASLYAAVDRHRKAWLQARGRTIKHRTLTVRIAKGQLDRYLEILTDAVNLAAIYGDAPRAEDTAVYLVEAKVHELFR